MAELVTSTLDGGDLVAVGYRDRVELLPRDVRLLEGDVADLVAAGVAHHLASADACGVEPRVDLDELVTHLTAIASRLRAPSPGGEASRNDARTRRGSSR